MQARPKLILDFCNKNISKQTQGQKAFQLRQSGKMRLSEGRGWMPFTAKQSVRADKVEFNWRAKFKMAPLIGGTVVDSFENGRGLLHAKLLGLVTVAKDESVAVDEGEIQRYIAELPWCPTALLHNPDLNFIEKPDNVIRIWAFNPHIYVDLYFDDEGDIYKVFTNTRKREHRNQPWEGRFKNYKWIDGLRIPTKGKVMWHTENGPFTYWEGKIDELDILAT